MTFTLSVHRHSVSYHWCHCTVQECRQDSHMPIGSHMHALIPNKVQDLDHQGPPTPPAMNRS